MSESLTNTQLKKRLFGAAILIAIAVIVVPMLLGEPKQQAQSIVPKSSDEFESKIQPLSDGQVLKELNSQANDASHESVFGELIQKIESDPSNPTGHAQNSDDTGDKLVQSGQKASKSKSKAVPKSKPSTAKLNEPQSGWAVQVGIFSDAENAKAIAQMLRVSEFQPKYSSTVNSIGEATRVWIGPFANKEKARAISEEIEKRTGHGGYVSKLPFKP